MDTTKKGTELELKVFQFLKDLVANDDFYIPGKKSVVFFKKKYHSYRRNGDIIFDITIETYLEPEKPYSLLTIVECKNYEGSVGVNDVEEFESKIRQVGEHNTKGVIITNAVLQKGALNLVKSLGIGLLKLESDDQYEWINYRIDKKQQRLDIEQTEAYFTKPKNLTSKFVGLINRKLFDNIADVLIEGKIIDFYVHKEKYIRIEYVTGEKIESIANRLYQYEINDGMKLSVEKTCAFLSVVYPITFDFETSLANGMFGKINFDPLKISITSDLNSDPHRWRFTFAHELGHLVLHYKILKGILAENTDDTNSLGSSTNADYRGSKRLEIQANIFASILLLPETKLMMIVNRFFEENRIYKNYLYVDHQQVNQQVMFALLNKVSEIFDVSIETAKIRLIRLNVIKYTIDNSLKGIIKNNPAFRR